MSIFYFRKKSTYMNKNENNKLNLFFFNVR